jgi:WD40 repeat protein
LAQHYRAKFKSASLPLMLSGQLDDWPQEPEDLIIPPSFSGTPHLDDWIAPPQISQPLEGRPKKWWPDYQSPASSLCPSQVELVETVCAVALSSDGRRVARGTCSGSVSVWDLQQDSIIGPLDHGASVTCLTFSSDSLLLLSGSISGPPVTVCIWDTLTGRKIHTHLLDYHIWVTRMVFSSDSSHIIGLSWSDHPFCSWDIERGDHGLPETDITLSTTPHISDDNLYFEVETGWIIRRLGGRGIGSLCWLPSYYWGRVVDCKVSFFEKGNVLEMGSPKMEVIMVKFPSKADSWNVRSIISYLSNSAEKS